MKKMIVPFIGILVLVGIYLMLSSYQKPTPTPIANVPSTQPTDVKNRSECVEKAELKHRAFVITNAPSFRDENGTTIYELPPKDKMDFQNAKRANAIDVCYRTYDN